MAHLKRQGNSYLKQKAMACDYSLYPKNWLSEIRPRILARAGEVRGEAGQVIKEACCEFCKVENRLVGWRFPSGRFVSVEECQWYNLGPEDESAMGKVMKRKPYKICLTIAHLDHDKRNWDVKDERLAALCQGCHLGWDRKRHMEHARDNREKKKLQRKLF